MKQLFFMKMFCVFSVFLAVLACSSKVQTDSKKIQIAVVCSAAGANDNGYNQSAIIGLNKIASEYKNVGVKVIETSTDYPGTLRVLSEGGYNIIFSLEYDFDALIKGVGGQNPLAKDFPNTVFVVFNANPNISEKGLHIFNNVIPVLFNVHESSFLAGALSVLITENNEELFDTKTHSFTQGDDGRKIGFIGGTKSDGITVFSDGYISGVNYMAKDFNVTYTYLSTFNAGFSDSAAGGAIAANYYSAGANVVAGVAGAVGDGIDAKAKEIKKLSIQVDADKDAQQAGYILTSILKNTEVPVYDIATKYLNNSLTLDGKELNYTLDSKATGITELKEIEKFVKPSGLKKLEEIKAKINEISEKISNGEIKVSNAQIGEKLNISDLKNIKTVSLK